MMNLLPIDTAPKDGTWILLFGPSGCTTTPLRCEICRWYPEYRPLNPWQTHSDDAFADGGDDPTHWCPIPSLPQDVVLTDQICIEMHGILDALSTRRSYVWLKAKYTMAVRFCPECGTLPSSLWVQYLWIKDNPTVADLKLLLEACCIDSP